MGNHPHKHAAPDRVRVAVITASTTRKLDDDDSGAWLAKRLEKEGHQVVARQVVADDVTAITDTLEQVVFDQGARVVLINGGTGITGGDVTVEAVRPLFEKELSAFGTLFAMLSYEEIDAAAILSRACAGIVFGQAAVFCMPGSIKACKLAYKSLISEELGHLVGHLKEGRSPRKKPSQDEMLLA
jgi:molybdenum cofactor biosynthesis protein B